MIFESHAHYDDEAFDEDREELLNSMRENGIEYVVNVCAAADGLEKTLELTEKYPFVYGAVGVHPDDAGKMNEEILQRIQEYCRLDKVVAVGEIGLDYYWDKESHEIQKKWFEAQMEVARSERLPFIIHSREAAQDTLTMMKGLRAAEMSCGVIHCFSYSKEMAKEYLDMGLYIGIGGVVTFKNAKKLKEVAEYAPLEQILLETDCPYLAPVPHRGKRNTSLNLPYVAEEIARIKGISCEEVVEVTCRNAKKMFGIKD